MKSSSSKKVLGIGLVIPVSFIVLGTMIFFEGQKTTQFMRGNAEA